MPPELIGIPPILPELPPMLPLEYWPLIGDNCKVRPRRRSTIVINEDEEAIILVGLVVSFPLVRVELQHKRGVNLKMKCFASSRVHL